MDTQWPPTTTAGTNGLAVRLPARMKVLYVATLQRTGGWLAEAFAADGAADVRLEEVVGVTAGLARLRDEVFDAVLITHEPPVLDALDLIEGLRAGGAEEPMVVLGNQPAQELLVLCYEVGADAYCQVEATTTRGLIWTVAQAMERHELIRENRRLVQAERQRLRLEHQEAERLLAQQRTLITDLENLDNEAAPENGAVGGGSDSAAADAAGRRPAAEPPVQACSPLPKRLTHHYRELLRAYVVMGTGNLAREMTALADLLATAGVSARQAMQLHLHVLEDLIRGLGSRSARHVLNRADLLILEVMAQLADGYRERYRVRVYPPEQRFLPGFDPGASDAAA